MPKKFEQSVQNTLTLSSKVLLSRPRFVSQTLEFKQSVTSKDGHSAVSSQQLLFRQIVTVSVVRVSKSHLVLQQTVEVVKSEPSDMYYTFSCTLHRGKVHQTMEVPLTTLKALLDAL